MSDKPKSSADADFATNQGFVTSATPTLTSDIVVETAPGYAIASLMISSAQSQARALEAAAMNLNQSYQVGQATSTQCVVKILGEPGRQQQLLGEILIGNKL